MPELVLPPEFVDLLGALTFATRKSRQFLAEGAAGRRFRAWLPLLLRRFCLAWTGECSGQTLVAIALTGFRVGWPRCAWRILRALTAIMQAWWKPQPNIWVIEGVPLRPWVESVGSSNLTCVVWSGMGGPAGGMPDLPPAPAPPAAPDAPAQPPWPRGTILTRV